MANFTLYLQRIMIASAEVEVEADTLDDALEYADDPDFVSSQDYQENWEATYNLDLHKHVWCRGVWLGPESELSSCDFVEYEGVCSPIVFYERQQIERCVKAWRLLEKTEEAQGIFRAHRSGGETSGASC